MPEVPVWLNLEAVVPLQLLQNIEQIRDESAELHDAVLNFTAGVLDVRRQFENSVKGRLGALKRPEPDRPDLYDVYEALIHYSGLGALLNDLFKMKDYCERAAEGTVDGVAQP